MKIEHQQFCDVIDKLNLQKVSHFDLAKWLFRKKNASDER
jgi:hypothetical protein